MKHKRWGWRAGASIVAVAIFVGGIYAGRWAVKNRVSPRVRQHLEAQDGWIKSNTQLARIEYTSVHLPRTNGWGGGIKALNDGRLIFATGHGTFGVIGREGAVSMLPFAVDLAFEALNRHPVSGARNFNANWFRVTDINLTPLSGPGRFELLVGHHHFDAARECVDLWLSRAELRIQGDAITLASPFRKVFATRPCITFAGADEPGEAFNGWSSGGRILRVGDGKVLFSTGDHKWNGLRGYPALSQEDDSTLGKILLVDLETGRSTQYAKGLRNPQGLAMDSAGRVWETEHGPRGGDELNLIAEGGNYGWPYATYGTDYGPRPWPHSTEQGRHDKGTPPVFSWSPSIGTSNLIEVRGEEFPLWKNDLLVLSLANQSIHRLRLRDDRVVTDEPIAFQGYRLRDITQFADGRLAVLTDEAEVLLIRNSDQSGRTPYLDANRQLKRSADMTPLEREQAAAGGYGKSVPIDGPVVAAKDSESRQGRDVFNARCGGCHSTREDDMRIAPSLAGLIGRRIGSTEFAYSNALAGQTTAWSSLDAVAFAADPSALFPGSRMPPVTLNADEKRKLSLFLDELDRPLAAHPQPCASAQLVRESNPDC